MGIDTENAMSDDEAMNMSMKGLRLSSKKNHGAA